MVHMEHSVGLSHEWRKPCTWLIQSLSLFSTLLRVTYFTETDKAFYGFEIVYFVEK